MADRWLQAGIDPAIVRLKSGAVYFTTSTSQFDPAYSDCGVAADTSGSQILLDFIDDTGASDAAVTGETLFVHCDVAFQQASTTAATFAAVVDALDQPWLALRNTTSGSLQFAYNSGTGASPVWTAVGSEFPKILCTVDFKITLGSPHEVEFYVNGAFHASVSFTAAGLTSLDALSNTPGAGSVRRCVMSQTMAAVGISTVGGHVFTGKPTGAGASSAFSGTFADIDDNGIDDANFISSVSAADRSTFAYSNLPTLPDNSEIGDLFMYTRGRNDGSAPSTFKPVRRSSGGVDDVGSAVAGVGTGFAEFLTRYAGLSIAEYNGSEFGVESAT